MTIIRDECGHIKSWWDNHEKCIKCSTCSRESSCSTCISWTNKIWKLAEKRKTYSSRVMAKKKKSNKSSDEDLADGITTPHGPAAQGRTHPGGNFKGTCTQGSTSPPATCCRSTSQYSDDYKSITSHRSSSHWSLDLEKRLQGEVSIQLVENTAKFLQSKIDMEKCGRDWICSQNLVSSLTQTKFYKSQNQYFPTDNIPPLELEASLLDLSSKGKCSIPMRNIEIWEKRAGKLIAIILHADLFSSAAYLCMQQQTMSMPALSRLLEAVAKSTRHTTAMSTILVTEIFQARRDAVLATSKLYLENSNDELRNAPINSKTLFGNKIKEVAKGNFEAQQQRFLATS